MGKSILGLDLGTNSIGWALLAASHDNIPNSIIDSGVRIFPKAVQDKTPTPKNQERRNNRLARRVIQRRARRKERLKNYLISLNLLPSILKDTPQPEITLNTFGCPYQLRAKALDHVLEPYELGRVILHIGQRRGFQSNKKTLLGRDMLDDPDVMAVLQDEGLIDDSNKEERAFKQEISELRQSINHSGFRTLGEYLASLEHQDCKRNRKGTKLRTDRQMYRDELKMIFNAQANHHCQLTENVQIELANIIFHQRPLKLKSDRIGKCSLEPRKKRAALARLEVQQFRYLQDINHLKYFDPYSEQELWLTQEQKLKLIELFEQKDLVTFPQICKTLGLDNTYKFNLDTGNKKLKGNRTSFAIYSVLPSWNEISLDQKIDFVEDLITINKKSVLKKRLIDHWKCDREIAVKLCMLEFEPGHANNSLKAINKMLPFLRKGRIYSDARVAAGYEYESQTGKVVDRLGPAPEVNNPIVSRGLSEVRRVVNAIIAEYGKPDVIHIEMARDLEMNTKKYAAFAKQQKANTKENDEATKKFQHIASKTVLATKYPNHEMKLRYRLWKAQNEQCAYSGKMIGLEELFTANIEVDHILPYSKSFDDSFMNKVVCTQKENQYKGNRTPKDAYDGSEEKWEQISQRIKKWPQAKQSKFYKTSEELINGEGDFLSSQLNDTRYICKEAGQYLKKLGVDVTYPKGVMTSWLRFQWGLNNLIGTTNEKERIDHRHHTIDAAVIACIDRKLYDTLRKQAKSLEESDRGLSMKDIHIEPPFASIREQLMEQLSKLIVSHTPQHKISGALHKDTGVGFIDGIGTVYRKDLNGDFSLKNAQSIIDPQVKKQVLSHLAKYDNKPKDAFADGEIVTHKDNKTSIKRVRVVQAKNTLASLHKSKLPITDKQGKVFKWYAFGNTHCVYIFKLDNGKYRTEFVTAYQAKTAINTKIDSEVQPMLTLHKNDLVELTVDGEKQLHRIQKLESKANSIQTRLHTAARNNDKSEGIRLSVPVLMNTYQLKLLKVNAIGKLLD
ncbi:type II CRISPR RNA-guided endonuclease Cas9 [Shewanella sp. KX20019]|uniref:type II CRISPR RNA-guided endonuclease Cas9 n=1 Tax=Shewanella sp. KX20019 TaxID=2803864 RepID=UPI0019256207|nr:type II CRISPR RNA-guided endonuclease Cas9 [Shewanella sp. KX20019]QQX81673.1 type II CRISPR RNA-guided endonuclease Cas9 [Shewanella sp. KX20019]